MNIYDGILDTMTKEAGPIKWLARRAAKKRMKDATGLAKDIAGEQKRRAIKGGIVGAGVGAGVGAATAKPGEGVSGAVKGGLIGGVGGAALRGLKLSPASKKKFSKIKELSERTSKGKILY